jgi:hypothetical protein
MRVLYQPVGTSASAPDIRSLLPDLSLLWDQTLAIPKSALPFLMALQISPIPVLKELISSDCRRLAAVKGISIFSYSVCILWILPNLISGGDW